MHGIVLLGVYRGMNSSYYTANQRVGTRIFNNVLRLLHIFFLNPKTLLWIEMSILPYPHRRVIHVEICIYLFILKLSFVLQNFNIFTFTFYFLEFFYFILFSVEGSVFLFWVCRENFRKMTEWTYNSYVACIRI